MGTGDSPAAEQAERSDLEVARVPPDETQRGEAVQLAERIWAHLERRRRSAGPGAGLWDRPQGAFGPLAAAPEGSSWYYTRRVVDSLITAAHLVTAVERPPDHVIRIATSQLHRAERLHDQDLLDSPSQLGEGLRVALGQIGVQPRLARDMLTSEPSVTLALADEALRAGPARRRSTGRVEAVLVTVFAMFDKGGTGRSVTASNVAYRHALRVFHRWTRQLVTLLTVRHREEDGAQQVGRTPVARTVADDRQN